MKYRSIILSFFLLMPVSNCFADMQGYCMPQSWVGKIGQKAKEKVEKRVEEKVDKAMDKTLDKAEEEATRGQKRATTAPAPKTARKTISLQELEQETDRKTHHIGNTGKSVGRATGKNGCEILFPVKQGTRREMTIYEANGKVSGTIRQQVQSVTNTAKGMKITTAQEMYDKKGKQIFSSVANMWCDGDRFYVDAQSLLNEQTLKMFKDIKYKVTGVDIAYPSRIPVAPDYSANHRTQGAGHREDYHSGRDFRMLQDQLFDRHGKYDYGTDECRGMDVQGCRMRQE